jgi:hypothetical protein|tara:strand:- start:4162 stop:4902 length:741 start_codon:yes stop_codon:yes gene_type:complete
MGSGVWSIEHIPFPMPIRNWSLRQNWINLTFLHWEVDPNKLKKYVPNDLELDLFNGKAYVGTIPFTMENVRPHYLPSLPMVSTFPEFNIRIYVKKNNKAGVLFLTLEAHSRITCKFAPWAYGLPYKYAFAKVKVGNDNEYYWNSKRKSNGIELKGKSFATGKLRTAEKGTIEEFLFERYCLYVNHKGKTKIAHTQHSSWEFQDAVADIEVNTLTGFYDLGIEDLQKADLVHVTKGVKVRTWSLEST